jgi:hypothetical protein
VEGELMSTKPSVDPKALAELKARLKRLDTYVALLYEEENCSVGGPLHIVLDDGNMKDSDLVFCFREAQGNEWSASRATAGIIIRELMMLSPAQRRLWWEGHTATPSPRCNGWDDEELEYVLHAANFSLIYDDSVKDGKSGYRVISPDEEWAREQAEKRRECPAWHGEIFADLRDAGVIGDACLGCAKFDCAGCPAGTRVEIDTDRLSSEAQSALFKTRRERRT